MLHITAVLHMIFLLIMQKNKFDLDDNLLLEVKSTLHNVIILIKSAPNKNQNLYYWRYCCHQFFYSIIILRTGKTKAAKERFCGAKDLIKIWDVDVNTIVISKFVETKNDSNYLIGYLVIRPLVLVLPKLSQY